MIKAIILGVPISKEVKPTAQTTGSRRLCRRAPSFSRGTGAPLRATA